MLGRSIVLAVFGIAACVSQPPMDAEDQTTALAASSVPLTLTLTGGEGGAYWMNGAATHLRDYYTTWAIDGPLAGVATYALDSDGMLGSFRCKLTAEVVVHGVSGHVTGSCAGHVDWTTGLFHERDVWHGEGALSGLLVEVVYADQDFFAEVMSVQATLRFNQGQ